MMLSSMIEQMEAPPYRFSNKRQKQVYNLKEETGRIDTGQIIQETASKPRSITFSIARGLQPMTTKVSPTRARAKSLNQEAQKGRKSKGDKGRDLVEYSFIPVILCMPPQEVCPLLVNRLGVPRRSSILSLVTLRRYGLLLHLHSIVHLLHPIQ